MRTANDIRGLAQGSIVGFARALLDDAGFSPDNRSAAQRFDYWKHITAGTRYKLGRKCVRKVHDGKRSIDVCFTPKIQAWMRSVTMQPVPSDELLLADWAYWCLYMKALQGKMYADRTKFAPTNV